VTWHDYAVTDDERDAKVDRVLAMLDELLPIVRKLLKHPMLARWLK
jgi:hypothetical protein